MPKDGKLTKILDTGEKAYGGSGGGQAKVGESPEKRRSKERENAYEHYAVITLKPLSAVMYRYTLEDTPPRRRRNQRRTEAKKAVHRNASPGRAKRER